MKKRSVLLLIPVLCALLLSGCRFPSLSAWRYEREAAYTSGSAALTDRIERVEVHWCSGSVTVAAHDADTVSFEETARRSLRSDEAMRYRLDGTTLIIQFCRSGVWSDSVPAKDLTLLLPADLLLDDLLIESVSATVSVDAPGAESVRIDSVSGSVSAALTQAPARLEADTVSGSVELTVPSADEIRADSVSGAVTLTTDAMPDRITVGTVSGSVLLRLPQEAGLMLDFDTVSGSFTSELPCTSENGRYRCGDGAADCRVDTTSGSLTVAVR